MEKFPYILMVNFKISFSKINASLSEPDDRRCSSKQVFAIFAGKHLRWSLFFKKFQSFRPATLKETPAKVFSCEYCKIFKNSFFHRTLPVAASALYHYFSKLLLKRPLNYSKQRPCSQYTKKTLEKSLRHVTSC